MSDKIEVKFGAETSGLNAGARDAASAVESALKKMEGAFSRMSNAAKEGAQQTNNALNEVKEHSQRSAVALESIGSGIKGFISGAAIAMVGMQFVKLADQITLTDARLKLATKDSKEFETAQKEIYRIAQSNNVGLAETTTLYTKMAPAVRELGGGAKQTAAVVDAFATSLRISGASSAEASAATLQFAQAMGSGKLSGDEFRSMAENSPRFMKALADSMGVPSGALKTMAADGKLTADVVGNALIQSLDTLKSEAGSIPDTVGGSFERLKNDVYLLTKDFNSMYKVTATVADVIGIVTDYVKELDKVLKDTADATGEATDTTGLLEVAMRGIGVVFETVLVVGANVKFVLSQIGLAMGALAAAVAAVVSGDFKAVPVIFRELAADGEKARKELDAFEARVMKMGDNVAAARKKIKEATGEATGNGEKVDANLKPPKGMPSADKNKESRVAEWRAELTEKLEASKMYFGQTASMELQYWEGVKERNKLTVDEKRQVNSILFGLHKQLAQDERASELQKVDATREAGRAEIEMKRAVIEQRAALGQLDAQQELAELRKLKEQEYQLEVASLESKLSLIKEEGVARQKMLAELEEAKLKHDIKMKQDDTAMIRAIQQKWQTAFSPISSAFSTAVQGIIQGTNTVGQAVRNMAQSILLSYIDMGIKLLVQWTANKLAELAIGKTTAASEIAANAAVGASAAMASVAAIPFYGWAMAPEVGAAHYGMAMGYGANLAAEKGFDVPSGVNPVTQLHQKEMVLPASLADKVRNMTDESSGGAITVNISAVDSRGVRDLFMREGNALTEAIRKQTRTFGLTGKDLRGAPR